MSRQGESAPDGELTLEEAMRRLDEIAARLEGGELELTESLAAYEEGIRLLGVCEGLLGAAQKRIQQLRPHGDGYRLTPVPERA